MHNLKGTARGAGLTARVLVRTIMDGSTAVMYLGVISATRRHWGCPRKSVQFHFLVISRYIIITLYSHITPRSGYPHYIYIYIILKYHMSLTNWETHPSSKWMMFT